LAGFIASTPSSGTYTLSINKIHKLPVVGAGKLLGIITITDIASFLSPARRPGLSLSVLGAIARGRKAQETNLLFHKQ
jgi:CBS domain-containing protein